MSEELRKTRPASSASSSRSNHFHRLVLTLLPVQVALLASAVFSMIVLMREQIDTIYESAFATAGVAGALIGLALTSNFLLRGLRESAEAVVLIRDIQHAVVTRESITRSISDGAQLPSTNLRRRENDTYERLSKAEIERDEEAYIKAKAALREIRAALAEAERTRVATEKLSSGLKAELQMLSEADERMRRVARLGDFELASTLRRARLRLSDVIEAGTHQE